MADYTLNINAQIDEAERKLDKVDKKLDGIDKKAGGIKIEFPNLDDVIKGLKLVGDSVKFVWDNCDGLLGAVNPLIGALGDVKELIGKITSGAGDLGAELVKIKGLMPTTIVGTGFKATENAIAATAQGFARLGYVFFGLQQSINLVGGTFNAFFDNTIRRQAQLESTILQTRTTLASTARVLADGMVLENPADAIAALEGPIEDTIKNIRRRSLEIAGTTSSAIIQTFSVVAAQIGNIGGDLQDAEDLAISFAAALGTIGLSNPMYATQEIRSILSGNIDQNSVLARSLGITNEDVTKAKASAEGLVSWLEKRLSAFGAGQKIAATQLSGVLSNVMEVYQEFTREIGKPILAPLLQGINAVFGKISSVFKQLLGFAESLGFAFSTVVNMFQQIVGSSNFSLISDQDVAQSLESVSLMIGEFVQETVSQINNYIGPKIVQSLNFIKEIIDKLAPSVLKLVAAFAQFKISQFEVFIDSLAYTFELISLFKDQIAAIIDLYSAIMSQPLLQYLSKTALYVQAFEKIGVNGMLRFVAAIWIGKESIVTLFKTVKSAFDFIMSIPGKIASGVGTAVKSIETEAWYITTKLVQFVAQLGQIISNAVRNAAIAIKVNLVEIAGQAQATGTAMGTAISQGALAMAGVMDKVADAAGAANKSMVDLEKNAPDVADAIGKPFERIKKGAQTATTWIGTKFKAALVGLRTMLISTAKSMLFFSAQMAIITVAVGAVVQAYSTYMERLQQDREIRDAEVATRQLAGALSDVNDQSSAFVKAMKERAVERQKQGIENLETKLKDLKKGYEKAIVDIKTFQTLLSNPNFGNKEGARGDFEAGLKAAQQQVTQYLNYKKRLEDLLRAQAADDQREEDKKTIQIMQKERTGLEERIKKEREKLERELADYQFRLRQEIERAAFSEREQNLKVEEQRIIQAQNRAKAGLTGTARAVADILDQYENDMRKAEQDRQKRAFDLQQKIAQLNKSVADYEFKLKEQQAKLQAKVGDFNKKIENYITKEKRRQNEEDLRTAIEISRLKSQGFVVYADKIEEFKNAAAAEGLSATNLLAYLYAGGAEANQIGPETSPTDLIKILKEAYPGGELDIFKAGNLDFPKFLDALVQQTNKLPGVAKFAIENATADLGTIFKKEAIKAPPRIEDLNLGIAKIVADRDKANKQLIDAIQQLNQTFDRTSKLLAEGKLDALTDRSLFTDMNRPQDYREQRTQAQLALELAKVNGGKALGGTEFESLMIEFKESIVKSGLKRELDAGKISQEKYNELIDDVSKTTAVLQAELKEITPVLAEIKQINFAKTLIDDIKRLKEEGFDGLITTTREALEAFAAFGQESDREVKQLKIESALRAKRLEMEREGIKSNEEINTLLEEYRKTLEATADQQEELRQFLEPLILKLRLATEAAAELASGYQNAAKELLAGGDLNEVSRKFAEALAGKTIDTFVEWVFKDMQKQLEEVIGKALGLEDVEEQIRDKLESTQKAALDEAGVQTQAIQEILQLLRERLQNYVDGDRVQTTPTATPLPLDGEGLTPGQAAAVDSYVGSDAQSRGIGRNEEGISANDPRYGIGQTVGGQGGPNSPIPINLPVQPYNSIVPFEKLGKVVQEAGEKAGVAAEKTTQAAAANADQATTAENVQGALAGATQMLLGVGMVASGISQIQEGGTSNVLLGIGSVLMGVGSFGLGLGRMPFFADGGYVNGPTVGMIGEGGQGEYVIPENKMASSMAKWSQGVRGKDVVEGVSAMGSDNRSMSQASSLGSVSKQYSPGNNYSSSSNFNVGDGGSADNFSINITGEQLVFNERNYISQDEVPSIISQASKQGEARTLRRLRMSQNARTKVGL